MPKRIPLLLMLGVAFFPVLGRAQEATLAQKAKKILHAHCYRCHGEKGAIEGGVNYLLDRNQLVGRGKVTPNEPMKSRIIKRILLEEMPPDGEKSRPSAAELAILKDWIAQGAADFNPPLAAREFITHANMLDTMQKDLRALPGQDRRFARYFTFTHLYNANLSDDELTSYRQGLSKLINSLSWGKKIARPVPIDPAQTILRIDLRDYKWSARSWEMLESHYPYGLFVNSPAEKAIQDGAGARMPFLRGDWFVASAALPPLYHDLLNLPMTDRALEAELRVSLIENLRDGEAMRAAFNGSGVSRNNRLIERHPSLFGAYWKSYDFAGNTERQNLFASPLGPGVRVTYFKHDGGEIIFSLPNGLQGYMLVDSKGSRLDRGPTEIVSDPRRPDRTVVNGLSCMSCHSRGIIPKDDQVRPHVEKNRQAFLKDELQQILALYPSHVRMQKVMEEDASRFREAVEKTGCQLGVTEPIAALTQRFESEVDLTHAAAELGMPVAELQKRFDKSITLGRSMGPLAIEGGTVQREAFTDGYARVIQDLTLGTAMPRERRGGFSWSAPGRGPGWTPPTWTPPKIAPVELPVTPKPPRTFAGTPSTREEDPWYYRVSTHPTGQLHALAISPKDRNMIAHEATTGVIAIFHRGNGDNWSSMSGHRGHILALDFSPDGALLASGSIDQSARIWNVETGAEIHNLTGHAGFVRSVKFSPDGKWLAAGSDRVRLWNVATGREGVAFASTPTWIDNLAFSPDGKTIATASKIVQLWEASTGKLLHEINDLAETALSLAFSADGKLLAIGASGGQIHLWDCETKKSTTILKGHRQPVASVVFNCNGKLLLSAGRPTEKEPGEFKAWDPATGAALLSQTGHKSGIAGVAISADGRLAITAGLDGHFRLRDLMPLDRVPLEPFEGHFPTINCTTVSPEGKIVATGGQDRTVRIWDARSGAPLHRFDGHTSPVHGVVLTNDNKFAFSAGADGTLCKWDLTTGKLAQSWTMPKSILALTASRDGTALALVVSNDYTRVIDIATGKVIGDVKGPERAVSLSPDGKRVAGHTFQKGMFIWDIATGKKLAAIGESKRVYSTSAFSPDGKHLLTGARDNSVYLWDAATGEEVTRYKGCTREVHCVAFADDGKKILASCGAMRTPIVNHRREYLGCAVLMWDITGKEVRRWDTQSNIINRLAIADRSALFCTGASIQRIELP